MTKDIVRLPNIPHFAVEIIEAPLEIVAGRYGGELLSAHLRSLDDTDGPRNFWKVTGPATNVSEPLGLDELPKIDWLDEQFPVRGSKRLSTIRSNPKLTLIESPFGEFLPYEDEMLSEWTGAGVFRFWSSITPDPVRETPEPPIIWKNLYPDHGMSFATRRANRKVSMHKEGRYKFQSSGTLLPFENPELYKRRPNRDRLNRNIICTYIEAIGVDPEAIFERHELDETILFSADIKGDDISGYENEKDRYQAYLKEKNIC